MTMTTTTTTKEDRTRIRVEFRIRDATISVLRRLSPRRSIDYPCVERGGIYLLLWIVTPVSSLPLSRVSSSPCYLCFC